MSKTTYSVNGTGYFRHTIVCSLLSGKAVNFENIRTEGETVGLKDHEVNFLRLMDKVTNGTVIEINETGTRVKFKPGVIVGGAVVHDCTLARGVGYCAEPLLLLAPFAKKPLSATLHGVSNNQTDLGVDVLRTVTIPLLKHFGVEAAIRIRKRGVEPRGGGEVVITSENVRKLTCTDLTERGKIKRIRGVAFSCRTSPDLAHRAISTAKGLLLKLLPDIFIAADHFTGEEAGLSSGYGLTLVSESTSATAVLSEELHCDQNAMQKQVTAEDIGLAAAGLLLDQVKKGGNVDSHHQLFCLLLAAIAPDNVTRVRLGPLTPAGDAGLTLCRDFFSISFSTKKDTTYSYSPTTIYSCIGASLTNVSKKSA
ncbi:putative RNA 3prime-terminal phosphate cyclase-like protein [Diplonema papillatum]|nr:putative RNA 3prime-terminal phosphate cyclase-like protein [Diplonema papillatum]